MQILDFIRFTVFKWYIINQNSVILVSEQCQHFAPGYYVILFYHTKLRETFPYSEFFCSVFSRIRTEYEEIQGISPYLVRMRGNTVQKNSEYGQFSHKTILYFFFFFFHFECFPTLPQGNSMFCEQNSQNIECYSNKKWEQSFILLFPYI